jgi:hypothetical protein
MEREINTADGQRKHFFQKSFAGSGIPSSPSLEFREKAASLIAETKFTEGNEVNKEEKKSESGKRLSIAHDAGEKMFMDNTV